MSSPAATISQTFSMKDAVAPLERQLTQLLGNERPLRVLEAGCGAASHIDLKNVARVTGIDISEESMADNTSVDEKIVGDIQTYPLPAGAFDVAICWHVLEHLPRPELALRNLARAVTRDGLIVLGVPNVFSVKGLVTKFTPHRFHVWFYRMILGRKHAGTGGRGPFPTFMRFSISLPGIRRFARENALTVVYVDLYEAPMERELRRKYRAVDLAWRVLGRLVNVVSVGRIDPELCNCIVVLRNSPDRQA